MAFCPYCGAGIEPGTTFCPKCGKRVEGGGQGVPVSTAVTGTSLPTNSGKISIGEAVRMRDHSDRVMSVAWILLPFVGIAFGIVGVVSIFVIGLGGFAVLLGLSIVDIVLVVSFWYFLISRRNNHFKRDKVLRDGLVSYFIQEAAAKGKSNDISTEIATMNAINGEASAEETQKSAVLWIVLSIVTLGLLGLYVLYFLTKDPYRHDSRQQGFMQQTQSALTKLGKTVVNPSWKALSSRSFALYFVLSIVTLGLFEFYWFYTLIVDFNGHFKAQWQLEDSIMAAI